MIKYEIHWKEKLTVSETERAFTTFTDSVGAANSLFWALKEHSMVDPFTVHVVQVQPVAGSRPERRIVAKPHPRIDDFSVGQTVVFVGVNGQPYKRYVTGIIPSEDETPSLVASIDGEGGEYQDEPQHFLFV